jgi:hypothetical protein
MFFLKLCAAGLALTLPVYSDMPAKFRRRSLARRLQHASAVGDIEKQVTDQETLGGTVGREVSAVGGIVPEIVASRYGQSKLSATKLKRFDGSVVRRVAPSPVDGSIAEVAVGMSVLDGAVTSAIDDANLGLHQAHSKAFQEEELALTGYVEHLLKEYAGRAEDRSRFSVMTRSFAGRGEQLLNALQCQIVNVPPEAELVYVLDDTPADRQLGDCIKERSMNSSRPVRVFYEGLPADHKRMFPGTMKTPGYDQQQYSHFWLDNYTDRDVIGVFDAESCLYAPLVRNSVLSAEDGRLHVNAFAGEHYGTNLQILHEWFGPNSGLVSLMDTNTFPIWFWRDTFAKFRQKAISRFSVGSFDEAFAQIAAKSMANTHCRGCEWYFGGFSEFNLLGNFALETQADRYAFRLLGPSATIATKRFAAHAHPGAIVDGRAQEMGHNNPHNNFPEGAALLRFRRVCCMLHHSDMLEASQNMATQALVNQTCVAVKAQISDKFESTRNGHPYYSQPDDYVPRTRELDEHIQQASQDSTSRAKAYQQLQGATCVAALGQGIRASNQFPDFRQCPVNAKKVPDFQKKDLKYRPW